MKPLHIWGTVILSIMAVSALLMGFDQIANGDTPTFRLNGPAGTLLLAPALMAIVARFWHRVRSVPWETPIDATLNFAEPLPNYLSSVLLGVCLVGFAGLGFFGYQGNKAELVIAAFLLVCGVGLLFHKLRKGRAALILSPTGLISGRSTAVTWDRVVGAQASQLPWSTEIVLEIRRQTENTGSERSAGGKVRILPILLGADPVDLLRAIQVRRTAYTF
jgi:hypothetical protein